MKLKSRCTILGAIAALGTITQAPALSQGRKLALNEMPPLKEVSLDQKLDAQIPLDTAFTDEDGKPVTLRQYFGTKPVVLVMPFYKCAGSCTFELDGMVTCFSKMRFDIGKEFNVITVSINPTEKTELAKAKKNDLLGIYMKDGSRPEAPNGWHFLTGSWESINQLTAATGFHFLYDTKTGNIVHPSGVMVLTPQGKMSRYFYGTNYDPKTMRTALVEASDSKIGSIVDVVALNCSAFDMVTGKYTLSIVKMMRWIGSATALIVAACIGVMSFKHRRVPLTKQDLTTDQQPTGA